MGEGTRSAPQVRPYLWPLLAALLSLVALGAGLRLAKLPGLSLGYDELQSVTHADRPFPLSLLSAFLSDPHPPLYYELLSGWMALGTSDAWILLLSVAIGVALIPSVYHVGFRLGGPKVALFAALVCAIHPLSLYWSHHARMYGLVMLLALWAYHANVGLLDGRPSRRAVVQVVLLEVCLVYTHVAAPFALLFVWLAALAPHLGNRGIPTRWTRAHALVALFSLPYLYFPFTTGQDHMLRPDGPEILETLSLFASGIDAPHALFPLLGALVYAVVAGLLLRDPRQRSFGAAFLVAPFAVGALFSYAVKPIWFGPRTFAFLVPFVALALAGLSAAPGRAGRLAALLTVALLARGAVGYTVGFEKPERFADAARAVRDAGRQGDLVLVPSLKDKWALEWYRVGPDWDAGLWTGSRVELFRRFASLSGLRGLAGDLTRFGREPGDGPIGVLPARKRPEGPLPPARRLWIVARTASQRDALVERFGIAGAPERIDVLGLDVTLREPAEALAGR